METGASLSPWLSDILFSSESIEVSDSKELEI